MFFMFFFFLYNKTFNSKLHFYDLIVLKNKRKNSKASNVSSPSSLLNLFSIKATAENVRSG